MFVFLMVIELDYDNVFDDEDIDFEYVSVDDGLYGL